MRHAFNTFCPVSKGHISKHTLLLLQNALKERGGADLYVFKVKLWDRNVISCYPRLTITIMRTLLRPLNAHQLMEHTEIFLRHSEGCGSLDKMLISLWKNHPLFNGTGAL